MKYREVAFVMPRQLHLLLKARSKLFNMHNFAAKYILLFVTSSSSYKIMLDFKNILYLQTQYIKPTIVRLQQPFYNLDKHFSI